MRKMYETEIQVIDIAQSKWTLETTGYSEGGGLSGAFIGLCFENESGFYTTVQVDKGEVEEIPRCVYLTIHGGSEYLGFLTALKAIVAELEAKSNGEPIYQVSVKKTEKNL